MKWLLYLGTAASAWAAGGCTPVGGARIHAADLAAQVPAFAALDPALDIGHSPMAGVRRVFRTAELVRLARRYGVTLPAAPVQACFERATWIPDAAALLAALRKALSPATSGGNAIPLEITDYSRSPVPHGTLEFSLERLTRSGMWRGRLIYDQGRSTPVWARIRMTPELLGLLPASAQPPVVARGDRVAVEVSSGGVLLKFDAEAESSGRKGQSVIVKNPENGRHFSAVVEGKGKVSVEK